MDTERIKIGDIDEENNSNKSLSTEDYGDVAFYYRVALGVLNDDHWKFNLSEEESRVLLDAAWDVRSFENFWLRPKDFTKETQKNICDGLDEKETKVKEEEQAMIRHRVREFILGNLVYIMPNVSDEGNKKWHESFSKISKTHFEQPYENGITKPSLPKKEIDEKYFEVDDMYYTLDLVNEFLHEPKQLNDICSSGSSSCGSDEEDNSTLYDMYDSCGVKNLMVLLEREVNSNCLKSFQDLVFRVKPPPGYKMQLYLSKKSHKNNDSYNKTINQSEHNYLPAISPTNKSPTTGTTITKQNKLSSKTQIISHVPNKSSTAFRYQQVQNIFRNSPFWAKYRTGMELIPIKIVKHRDDYTINLIRDPEMMAKFHSANISQLEHFFSRRKSIINFVNPLRDTSSFLLTMKGREPFFPEFQYFVSSMPCILPGLNNYPENDNHQNDISLDDFSDTSIPIDSILIDKIVNNIQEHAKIKEIYHRILDSQQHSPNLPKLPISYGNPFNLNTSIKKENIYSNGNLALNNVAAYMIMKKVVALIIQHTGFDVCLSSLLSIFTDLAIHKFLNIGKTLCFYINEKHRSWSPEEILPRALKDNGVINLKQLEDHIYFDIGKYGDKLYETRIKLEEAYDKILGLGLDNDGDTLKYDNEFEQIISGNFFEGLGIDTLNLKDIGIEFTSVPMSLWTLNIDKYNALEFKNNPKNHSSPKFDNHSYVNSPTSPEPDYSDTIGLLKPFYMRSLSPLPINPILSCKISECHSSYHTQNINPNTPGSSNKNKKRHRLSDDR